MKTVISILTAIITLLSSIFPSIGKIFDKGIIDGIPSDSIISVSIAPSSESFFDSEENVNYAAMPFMNSETEAAAMLVVRAVIVQILTGNAERDAIRKVVDATPIVLETRIVDVTNMAVADEITNNKVSPVESVVSFLKTVSSGVNDLYLYFVPTGIENIYEFRGNYYDNDGNIQVFYSGVYFNSESGMVYGKDSYGLFGIGYDYDIDRYLVIPSMNSWIREAGYSIVCDYFAPLLMMYFDTERIKFEYDGEDWMLQLWKGNYVRSNGCEVGFYKGTGSFPEYRAVTDDQRLDMSLQLYCKDEVILELDTQPHWWLAGFAVGPFLPIDDMTIVGTVTFNSRGMLDAFMEEVSNGSHENFKAEVNGLTVSYSW